VVGHTEEEAGSTPVAGCTSVVVATVAAGPTVAVVEGDTGNHMEVAVVVGSVVAFGVVSEEAVPAVFPSQE